MGTRASFWIGDPRKINDRVWLGCVAWDGYPGGDLEPLELAQSPVEFSNILTSIASKRDDFAYTDGGWPYPWDDDIFLTDYTYAWFNNCIMYTCFHSGFVPLVGWQDRDDFASDIDDPTMEKVPAPEKWDKSQPDSIMVIRSK